MLFTGQALTLAVTFGAKRRQLGGLVRRRSTFRGALAMPVTLLALSPASLAGGRKKTLPPKKEDAVCGPPRPSTELVRG